jgi:DNA/RNA-binding domain of Phe-tRNA-synthetase-like protein
LLVQNNSRKFNQFTEIRQAFKPVHNKVMVPFYIENELKEKCPHISLGCIRAGVRVFESDVELLAKTASRCLEISQILKVEDISHLQAVAGSRKVYKVCGKDPARYRLSAEALLRRVASGKGLYQINNVVDLLNLVSISTGFSIGGYDADKIVGSIRMGIGKAGEPYEGLGRGELNIEGMPVFRDGLGAFGTSTSDSVRTGVSSETTNFLMVVVSYAANSKLEEAVAMAVQLLAEHADGKQIETTTIHF